MWSVLYAAVVAAAAVGGYVLTKSFVARRLRFVDGVQSPWVPWAVAIVVALVATPIALFLPLVTKFTALVFAVAGAIGVELLRAKKKIAGDLALALFFYAGIALGVVFATKAGVDDLEIYLFGDPLTMTSSSLAAVVLIGGVVAVGVWSLRRVLFAIVTDEAWARAEGLPVDTLSVALAALTAAVIVAGMKVVGLLLVAALMVLPVASAQLLSRSFRRTVLLAAGIGAASAFVGLIVGQVADLSISGCIVLVAAAVFTVASVVRRSLPAAVESQV